MPPKIYFALLLIDICFFEKRGQLICKKDSCPVWTFFFLKNKNMSSILFLKIFKNWYNIQQHRGFSVLLVKSGEAWENFLPLLITLHGFYNTRDFYSSKFKNALVESIKQEIFHGCPLLYMRDSIGRQFSPIIFRN